LGFGLNDPSCLRPGLTDRATGPINGSVSELFFDPVFLAHDAGEGHPECPARLEAILKGLEPLGSGLPGRTRPCRPVELSVLYRVHEPRYVAHVEALSGSGGGMLDPDTAVSAGSFAAALAAAGAAVSAVEGVARGEFASAFCAVRPPGHHAMPSRGMGFCLFNNIAVAAAHAREALGIGRVLIVDWDAHHGNGTQAVFDEDPDVFYLSLHRYPHYPGTGSAAERGKGRAEGTKLNVPLAAGTGHDEFMRLLKGALAEVRESFRPELVLVSCGFDGAEGDPLGGLALRPETYAEATLAVRELARSCGHERIVSILEGGYDLDSLGDCARAHFGALP